MAVVFVLVFLLIMQQEELIGWHPGSGVRRTRIRVIGVNFSDIFLIKGTSS